MPRGVRKTANTTDEDKNQLPLTGSEPKANDIPEVTIKNKKSEILDALHAALEREKKRNSSQYDPEQEERRQQSETAVKETRQNVGQNVFSEELNTKFNRLELAIATEEEKLHNLYQVEKELCDITAILNAKSLFTAKIEEEKENETKAYEAKIRELEQDYKDKQTALEKDYAEQSAELEKARQREKEEYEYTLKRERATDRDAWEDTKKKREQELSDKERELDELLKEATANKERMTTLETRIENLPDELKSEYDKGYSDATKELNKEKQYSETLLKKDFQSTIDRQTDKIKALEATISQYKAENQSLQEKLDHAYTEIKEMATKTVESSGGVKILGSDRNDTN